LRARGITILFVSHSTGDVKALGDRAMWLDHGRVTAIGKTDLVVHKYSAAMAEKDAKYLEEHSQPLRPGSRAAPDEIVEGIPNVDHRFGDGCAEGLGIGVYDISGRKLSMLRPASACVVRISARAKKNLDRPIVGFMFRNHLGVDFAGTNTAREGYHLPPLLEGEICTVDFYVELP